MKRALAASLCIVWISTIVRADTFGNGANEFTIDFVTIGNPGNSGDTRTNYPDSADPYGCGAVDYAYRIGKYEVTNAQWDAFIAAAGAPTGNPIDAYDVGTSWSGMNLPTSGVSWYEAAQFCNYLTSGDKSLGAYLFSGNNAQPDDFLRIDRDAAVSSYGVIYVIPTEDEWYKAAYYKADGSGYSTYTNGLNTIPAADEGWNYFGGAYSDPWDVGTGTMEQNGTFDMMGNVWEWNEALVGSNDYRGLRGGSYFHYDGFLRCSYPYSNIPSADHFDMGFRIVAIPEPCSIISVAIGSLLLVTTRKGGDHR